MSILLYPIVALGYLGLGVWAWRGALPRASLAVSGGALGSALLPGDDGRGADPGHTRFAPFERFLVLVVWALHLSLLLSDFNAPDGLRFGFAAALSATMWVAVMVFWIESLYVALASMRLLVLPIAALCSILPAWFPGTTALAAAHATRSPAFDAHLVVALAAYSLLTIAALHALLMTSLDRWLHRADIVDPADAGWVARAEAAVLGQLPPLLTMERILFRLVAVGFVLLTLTVLTGIVFSEALFGMAMRFDHKTVFTLIAWFIFAALLFGRVSYGWRGRVALRWTLSGFVAMFLAYAGSRFVLEVILHRV